MTDKLGLSNEMHKLQYEAISYCTRLFHNLKITHIYALLLNGQLTQNLKFCHLLITLMWYLNFFFLKNIIWRIVLSIHWKSVGSITIFTFITPPPPQKPLIHCIQNLLLCSNKGNAHVWRLNKWQNFNFGLNYPFKDDKLLTSSHISKAGFPKFSDFRLIPSR